MEQNENSLSVLKIAPGQYPQQVEMPSTRSGASWGTRCCCALRCSKLVPSPEAFWARTEEVKVWQLIFPCRAISAR